MSGSEVRDGPAGPAGAPGHWAGLALVAGLVLLVAAAIGEAAIRLLAAVSPDVHYLATTRTAARPRRFATLQEFLASRPEHVVPYRRWFNYWTNALGFNDEEFVVPKPAGRLRIMAVGDSATYGLVPYPDNVMTVLEGLLREACPGRDLDLLNFGIAASGVPDYRTVIELGLATYQPDLVLVNLYVGNDAPNLYARAHPRGRGAVRTVLRHSYLWTYARSALALHWSGSDLPGLKASVEGSGPLPAGPPPQGGHVIDPGLRLRDDDPALVGPVFSQEAFLRILDDELGRFYAGGPAGSVERAWGRTLEDLDRARAHVQAHGSRLVITLYPSLLQVDPELRAAVVDRLQRRDPGASAAATDPALPGRVVAGFCGARGLPCFDLTAAFVQASQESRAPLYKAGDAHWTPRGNRVAARAQGRHLAPLVCPAGSPPGGPAR